MEKTTWFNTVIIAEELKYDNTDVLKYRIKYPEFKSGRYKKTTKTINQFYRDEALALQCNQRTKLYRMAVDQYLYDVENGFPVRIFEHLQTFEVTCNRSCIISLYFDNYQYTGGAHGVTPRTSQTWNLQTGQRLKLSELFECLCDYKAYIKRRVIAEIKKNPAIYFEDYEQLVEQTFDINSFYCTPKGVVVYFQQYDIAPYSSGIREFLLPYNECLHHPVRKCNSG